MATERKEGKTPHGGTYSVVVWMDIDRWVEVEKSVATGAVVTEYGPDGNQIFESVARLDGPA